MISTTEDRLTPDQADRVAAGLRRHGAKLTFPCWMCRLEAEWDMRTARWRCVSGCGSNGNVRELAERFRITLDDANGHADEPALTLAVRAASQIAALPIEWLWERWLPRGMIALFAGFGGQGKSTVALSLAAAGSTGGTFPDGSPAPTFSTLILAAEDDASRVIVPRLTALGADLCRIFIVDGTVHANGEPGWVQLRQHAALIEAEVTQGDIGLVIIDPVSSYIGDANSDRESDVRSAVLPLAKLAERTGCAVLLIRHLSKAGDDRRATARVLGSTAWTDMPRAVWMLADAPEAQQPEPGDDGLRDTERVLGVVKSNLAAKPPPLALVQPADGPLRWTGVSSVSIDECFTTPPSERVSAVDDATRWLAAYLAGGSQPVTAIERDAAAAGFTWATMRRAKTTLSVRSLKVGGPGAPWLWALPEGTPRTEPADD